MNAFKRATTNIKRQPVKSGILLFLVLILATVSSGAISTRQAINNTEESLMLQTPTVATLSLNAEAAAEEAGVPVMELGPELWRTGQPSREEISAVGNLPYVRAYDSVMTPSLKSQNLELAMPEIDEQRLPDGVNLNNVRSMLSVRELGAYVEIFHARGVANPDLTDIDAGLIELVDGQTFAQADIDNKTPVVIISQAFAEKNNLYVGAMIEFENIVSDTPAMAREGIGFFVTHWHEERFMAAHQLLEFEVVGIFDTYHDFNYHGDDKWMIENSVAEYISLHNRIYMPISVAEEIIIFQNEGMLSILDAFLEMSPHYTPEELIPEEPLVQSIFVVYDPRYLDELQAAGSEILPGFWEITDLRGVNSGLIASMDTMRGIADMILIIAAGATITILTLIITLLLRDRRHEIGIYMALGEKKSKVIFQFLTEIIIVSTIAITIALFVGNGLSTTISRNLLEQNLTRNAEQDDRHDGAAIPWELALFNSGELSIEETLDMYNTSLGMEAIAIFVSVSSSVILLSTVVPVAYVVKLEPKKVLRFI